MSYRNTALKGMLNASSPMRDEPKKKKNVKYIPTKRINLPGDFKGKTEHDQQVERKLHGRDSKSIQEAKDRYKMRSGHWITAASDTARYREANPNIKYKWIEKPK